ncbi:hypothetical protein KBB05_03570, partial [Patescibacteria group bacterium]|nr:hypothetical protein [Patescibacteria group bacterium]
MLGEHRQDELCRAHAITQISAFHAFVIHSIFVVHTGIGFVDLIGENAVCLVSSSFVSLFGESFSDRYTTSPDIDPLFGISFLFVGCDHPLHT